MGWQTVLRSGRPGFALHSRRGRAGGPTGRLRGRLRARGRTGKERPGDGPTGDTVPFRRGPFSWLARPSFRVAERCARVGGSTVRFDRATWAHRGRIPRAYGPERRKLADERLTCAARPITCSLCAGQCAGKRSKTQAPRAPHPALRDSLPRLKHSRASFGWALLSARLTATPTRKRRPNGRAAPRHPGEF